MSTNRYAIVFSSIVLSILLNYSSYAVAANDRVGPFGFGVGITTFDEAKQFFDDKMCDATSTSDITNGPFVECPASRINEIENLQEMQIFIFNEDKILVSVQLTMNNDNYNNIISLLSKKYKLRYQKNPYVGDKFSTFISNDNLIDVEAPPLSFEMTIIYKTKTFEKLRENFNKKKNEDKNTKTQDNL
jgi:hypothetical protein